MTTNSIKVGVLMPRKKWNKHGFETCTRIQFILLSLEDLTATRLQELEVSVILHKLIDLLPQAEMMKMIEIELEKWGGKVIDGLDMVNLLCDRRRICDLVKELVSSDQSVIHLPPTFACDPKVIPTFPVIRKPVVACSHEDSHLMCLFFSPNQLESSPNYIIQQYIPHGGILYKVYVIGDQIRIQLRPSLEIDPNTTSDEEPRPFDSQTMKREGFQNPQSSTKSILAQEQLALNLPIIQEWTEKLKNRLDLTLFGWDLIIEEETGKLFVIDVNYFPGYDEVDFLNLLCDTLLR